MPTTYPRRVTTRGVAWAACGLLGVAWLTGCGGDEADGSSSQQASTAPTPTADPDRAEGSAAEVAPADLANFSCTRLAGGRWKATGDVTNSAGEPMVYTVTVVTVDADSRVLGERIAELRLKPDQSQRFRWSQFYDGSAETCMPHVERRPG